MEVGLNFGTTAEFIAELDRQLGSEHILVLGISCHGSDAPNPDTFGGAAIQGENATWLREGTIGSYTPFLTNVGRRLEINGIVYFYSCRVGGTEPGRRLLMGLSNLWRGRRVVGFVDEGHQHAGGQRRAGLNCELPGVQFGSQNLWGDWGIPGAVVALNGRIVRG